MRLALFQGPSAGGDVGANLAAIDRAARCAAAEGADLLVTPEMSATGYNIGAAVSQRAETSVGPLRDAIAQIAVKHGVAIIYGYPERTPESIYNTASVIGTDGTVLGTHRKTHLYGELDRRAFRPGERLVSQFTFDGFTCGLAICYEVEFPEVVRAHADSGTDVLFVPTALMPPFEVVGRIVVPARAYENQMFVVYANRCDVEDGLAYCGLSCVVGPDGADVVRAGAGEEFLVATIDPAALATGRSINTHRADRRGDLYPIERQRP